MVDLRGIAAAPVRTALQVIFECLGLEEQAGTLQDKKEDEDDCGVDYSMDGDTSGGGNEDNGEGEVVGRGFGLPSGDGRAEEAAVVRRTVREDSTFPLSLKSVSTRIAMVVRLA